MIMDRHPVQDAVHSLCNTDLSSQIATSRFRDFSSYHEYLACLRWHSTENILRNIN